MKKLGVMALLVLVSACGSDKFDRDAIRATVVLEGDVKATCVLLEVRDPADERVLGRTWLPRAAGDTELRAAIFKASLPTDVQLAARPYLDGSCANNTEAQTPNGNFVTGTASFAVGKVVEAAPLTLQPGTDADGDGYVNAGSGGADCADSVVTVNPGVQEVCSDQADLNCDSRKGCEASACAANSCVGPPAALVLTLPSGSLTAGTCEAASARVIDANGSNTRVGAAAPLALQAAPAASLGFFSDAACTASVTSVTMAANAGSASFFVLGKAVGSITVSATLSGLPVAMGNVTVIPGEGDRLAFQTAAQTVNAGACSGVVRVRSQDSQGNPSPVTTATTVTLSASPDVGFKFYSSSGCAAAAEVGSVSIAANASEATFYFRSTKSGPVTVTVTANGFTGDSQQQTINPGPPAAIALIGPQTVQAGACSSAIPIELRDNLGNPAPAGAGGKTINLSTGAGLTFYSTSTCANPVTSVTVPQGSSAASFFVRSTVANTYAIVGQSSGLTNGTTSVTVNPGPPSVIAFTTAQQTVQAGQCSAVATVQLRDDNGNLATLTTATPVNLSVDPSEGFEFFTQAGCAGTAVTAATIAAGASTASFYFKSTKSGPASLTAAFGTLSVSQGVTINPAPPAVLVFAQLPSMALAGACTQVTLQVRDSFGNPSPVSGDQSVSLTASPNSGFTFYPNTTCSSSPDPIRVLNGQSTVSFSLMGTKAGAVTLSASMGSVSSATPAPSITITPLAASKLVFTTQARTATAEVCSSIVTIQSADTYDNVVPIGTDELIMLTENGSPTDAEFKFYSNPGCTIAVTNVTISATQSAASFYFKGRKARTVPVTADGSTLADTTQNQTVVGAAASSLAFSNSTPSAQLLAGTCALRTVESLDDYGNPAGSALTLTLSGTPLAEFFSDANCTVAISQLSMQAGSGSANFYFKGFTGGINALGALELTVTSTTPSLSATQTQSILPTVRTGSCNIGGSASSTTCIIGLPLGILNRSFLVFQATSASASAASANVRCYLNPSNTSQILCDRAAASGGGVNIQWSAAEFPSGVNVQHQPVDCASNSTNVPLTAVTRGSSFLLLSSKRNVNDQGNDVPRLAELTANNSAQIRKEGGCNTGEADANHLQVVEYTGANVQRLATTTLPGNSTFREVTLSTAVAMDRAIVLFSYISDSSAPEICNRALRGELINNGATLRFSRAEGNSANSCASGNVTDISWEVIQFPPGTYVQQVTQQLAASATSATVMLPNPVDASRTIVLMGGQGASGQISGEGRHSASQIIGEMRARASLNAQGTAVTLTRDSANSSATFTVYVVQLKP